MAALTWRHRAGPWLAIGTSPAGLALGAALATEAGELSATVLVVGAVAMALALWMPARLGLVRDGRPGGAFTDLADRVLTPAGARALAGVLTVALAGWFAVNAAMGGAGLAAALDLPAAPTIAAVAGVEALLVRRGLAGWNRLAIVATLASLALIVSTGARVDGLVPSGGLPPLGTLTTQTVAFVGYVAVFGIRSPDFTAGLGRRRDLAANVALLLVTTTAGVVVGSALTALTGPGSDDLASRLGDGGPVPGGGAFLLLATVAPALVAGHSARRCLHALARPRPQLAGPGMISLGSGSSDGMSKTRRGVTGPLAAAVATGLAVTRPDTALVPWLAGLGAALPAIVIPLSLGPARRRGRAIPTWTWLPGVAAGAGLGLRWHALGLLTSLTVTGLATYGWSRARSLKPW